MTRDPIATPSPGDSDWRSNTFSPTPDGLDPTGVTSMDKIDSIKESERHGTILSGFSVITKSMIGSGIFSMAHACSKFGILAGCLLLLLAAAITWLSLKVLAKLALDFRNDNPTFYSVSEKILPRWKWVIDVALIINCMGGAIVYVQTAGNLMAFALISAFNAGPSPGGLTHRFIAMIVQAIMIMSLAPLCMMKEISSTKIANLIGLTCLLYIMICTFFYTPLTAAHLDGVSSLMYPEDILKAIGSFPTFIFAFACQQNEFTVANELKNANKKRLDVVNISATLTGFIVYMPMMLLPFLTFGRPVKSNYLYNLDEDGSVDVPIIIAFFFASISVSISYVLQVQPVRRSLESLIYGTTNKPTGRKEVMSRVGLATIILLTSFGLAVGLGDDLSLPINVAGLLGGNTMCFVMPFLLYLNKYGFDKRSPTCIALTATLVFCIALYPICLTGIIYEAVNRS
jgi:amino acid permease